MNNISLLMQFVDYDPYMTNLITRCIMVRSSTLCRNIKLPTTLDFTLHHPIIYWCTFPLLRKSKHQWLVLYLQFNSTVCYKQLCCFNLFVQLHARLRISIVLSSKETVISTCTYEN